MSICGYVPFYNNAGKVGDAVRSLLRQDVPLDEVFAVDDGSTEGGTGILKGGACRVVRHNRNLGRGAARARAMMEAKGDLVVCCDATNVLPLDFVRRMLPWFDDPNVAAAYGRIEDPNPSGPVSRWRMRHLFKKGQRMDVRCKAPLITYGTIVRRSAVLRVGNYDPRLRHSEDAELGERLLAAGYDIICDPQVPVYCNVRNSLPELFERYWRWYAGKTESISWTGYARDFVYSVRGMAAQDLKDKDLGAAIISLLCPHYRFWRTVLLRLRKGSPYI